MRKLFLSIMTTLDGFAAGPNGELDWIKVNDEEHEDHMAHVLRNIDAMVFGRVAYQLLAGYWPTAGTEASSTDGEVELARLMNTVPKIVVSRTPVKLDWTPARQINENLKEEIARMKQERGKDLALFAGASIASTFMDLDLIDEYRLMVYPVVLGEGQRLFKQPKDQRNLRFTSAKTFQKSGVVILRYQRDHATPSFSSG